MDVHEFDELNEAAVKGWGEPYFTDDTVTLWHGDALEVLSDLPDQSVDCCVTSPPYYGLRDYGTEGQYGLEESPAAYVETMRALFAEVRRVLADDGTLWLNIGDSYASGTKGSGGPSEKQLSNVGSRYNPIKFNAGGLRDKNLMGIPWMVAKALQTPYFNGRIKDPAERAWLAGWLDGEGSITYVERDRGPDHTPTHDIKAFITNCDDGPLRYFAEMFGGKVYVHDDGTRENRYGKRVVYRWQMGTHDSAQLIRELYPYLRTKKRQAALVWTLFKTLRHQNGHARTPKDVVARRRELAAMVRTLNAGGYVELPSWVEEPPPCEEPAWILRNDIIWAKPNAMPESVTDRLSTKHEHLFMFAKRARYWFDLDAIREGHSPATIERNKTPRGRSQNGGGSVESLSGYDYGRAELGNMEANAAGRNPGDVWSIPTQPYPGAHFAVMPQTLASRCIEAGCKPGGTVLDPFSGSGTTGLAAAKHGRKYVGIDLNAEYLQLSLDTRLVQPGLIFDE